MAKIAIFAGHGGSDPGACAHGRTEANEVLKIANSAAAILESAGHEIIRNRTTNTFVSVNQNISIANNNNVDYVVEIHLNAGGGKGTETYHSIVGGEGQTLAQRVNSRLASLGFANRGAKTKRGADGSDYLGIIRETKAPAILIEVCFIDNADDLQLLDSVDVAAHLADEIHNFVGGEQPAPTPPSQPVTQDVKYIGVCVADILNVRSGGSINAPIVFRIAQWNEVNILDVSGDGWLHINCAHGNGWCMAKYIDWNTGVIGTCNTDLLNVRSGETTDYGVVYQLANGNKVQVLHDRETGWLYIDCLHGKGYCAAKYISR